VEVVGIPNVSWFHRLLFTRPFFANSRGLA
jgi:hypothetical protein